MITKINLNKPFCVLLSCALTVLSCHNLLVSKLPYRFLHLIPCPKGPKHTKAINIKKQFRFQSVFISMLVLCGTCFYNNAVKIFGAEVVWRRR